MSLLTTTTLSGEIIIGSDAETAFHIPLKAALNEPIGQFTFEYTPQAITATKLVIGDFLDWLKAQLNIEVDPKYLPTSLQQLTFALEKLNLTRINTAAASDPPVYDLTYDIKVQIGKMVPSDSGRVWTANWQPIDGLPFTISNIGIEVERKDVPPSQ